MNSCHTSLQRAKANSFLKVIGHIAKTEGYTTPQANELLLKFRSYSSSNFICGPPTGYCPTGIPQRIWQKVGDHYNLFARRPFVRKNMAEKPAIFKEKSMVFITKQLTEKCIKRDLIHEVMGTVRRLYQYLNWTIRIR